MAKKAVKKSSKKGAVPVSIKKSVSKKRAVEKKAPLPSPKKTITTKDHHLTSLESMLERDIRSVFIKNSAAIAEAYDCESINLFLRIPSLKGFALTGVYAGGEALFFAEPDGRYTIPDRKFPLTDADQILFPEMEIPSFWMAGENESCEERTDIIAAPVLFGNMKRSGLLLCHPKKRWIEKDRKTLTDLTRPYLWIFEILSGSESVRALNREAVERDRSIQDLKKSLSGSESLLSEQQHRGASLEKKIEVLNSKLVRKDTEIQENRESLNEERKRLGILDEELKNLRKSYEANVREHDAMVARSEKERESLQGLISNLEGELNGSKLKIESIEREKRDALNEISLKHKTRLEELSSSYENKISDVKNDFEKQILSLIEENENGIQNLNQTIAELRGGMVEFDKLKRELGAALEEKNGLETELKTVSDSLNTKIASLSAEIVSARSQHEDEKRAHESEKGGLGVRLAELEKTIMALEEQNGSDAKRLAELEETEALYAKENSEIRNELNEAQTKLGSIRAEYENQISELTIQLEEQKNSADKNEARFDEEIALLKQELSIKQGLIETIEAERAELKEISDRTIRTLEAGIAEQQKNHAIELAHRDSEYSQLNETLEIQRREAEGAIRNFESLIQARDETIVQRERTLSSQNMRVSELTETLALKELELADAVQLGSKLTKDLSDANEIHSYLREEIKSAGSVLAENDNRIRILIDSEKKLNSEIAGLRDHIRKLELSVRELQGREMGLNSELKTKGDRISMQQREIEDLNELIHQKKNEIQELLGKEGRLQEELKSAIRREENSKEEGRLIGRIIREVASSGDITEMLPVIRDQFRERGSLERIALLSFIDEDRLLPEAALCGDEIIENVQHLVIPLQDTIFGQAAAAQHTEVFREIKEWNADLPVHDKQIEKKLQGHPAKSFAIIPLVVNRKTVGIMSLGSARSDTFDDSFVNLIEAISPYFARSVLFNVERRTLASLRERNQNQNTVRIFIEKKYQRILSSAALPVEDSNDLFLHIPPQRKNESNLTVWTERLAKLIEKRLNAEVIQSLDAQALANLRALTDLNFPYLFWLFAEASDNMIRHSEATRVSFEIHETDAAIRLKISDNGEGLLRKCGTENPHSGSGFPAMISMVELTGGSFHSSKNSDGTGLRIEVEWSKRKTGANL